MFHTVQSKNNKRTDHVWHYQACEGHWICVLCGGVANKPPDFPTDPDYTPERYSKLTPELRKLSPFTGATQEVC